MNVSVPVPRYGQLFDADAIALWAGRVMAVSIIAYGVAYSFAIAPKRFADVPGTSDQPVKMTIRQISSLKTNMIPLELPPEENSLIESLHLQSDPQLRYAQLRLYRRALDLDNVFIVIYPLQLFSVVFLIWMNLAPQRRLFAASYVGSAALAIVATAFFDIRENFYLARILDMASAWNANEPVSFAAMRQAVTFASTWKWAAWGASCLLLFVLGRCSSHDSWLRRPGWVFAASGVLAGLGIVPRWHALLSLSVMLYGVVPLIIAWRLILLPPLEWADQQLEQVAQKSWQNVHLPPGMERPSRLTLDIYAGKSRRTSYRTWSVAGAMPPKSQPPKSESPKTPPTTEPTDSE